MVTSVHATTHNDPAPANAVQVQAAATVPASSQKSATAQASPAASTPTDTVQISVAAKSLVQEATETKTQRAQEALKGDLQAQRLLAKETPAKT
jgi:hypothetical protein